MTKPPPPRRTVGVLLDRLEDEYQNQVFGGLDAAARSRDTNLICLCGGNLDAPYESGRDRNFLFDVISDGALDGLVILSGSIANHVGVAALEAYCERFPALPTCSVGVRLLGMPNVLIDNAGGLEQSISDLLERGGRRRVAFVRGPVQNEEAEIRYRAYQTALARHGVELDPELVVCGDFQKGSGADAVRVLSDERRQAFDAIVAANDYMALGALDALLARGVDVPGAVAVCGFDDVEDARFAPVPLSTVRQPLHEQGRRALEILLNQIDSGVRVRDIVLPTRAVARASCGLDSMSRSARAPAADAEYAQAQERLRQARQIRALRRSGQALSSALAEQEVLSAMHAALPGIGIQRALLCLYEPPSRQPDRVRRIRIEAGDAEATGPTEDVTSIRGILQSSPWQNDRRYTAVAEPLFSNDGPLGVGIFEVGPMQGTVYEFLREQLSAAFCAATLVKRLVSETKRREEVEKEHVVREIELANRIQTGILPRELCISGLELAAGMLPAAQVGGDYYDVLPFERGGWLGIGDVAGHGLSTGLVMLMIQSVVAGLCVKSPDATPRELIAVLNQVVYANVRDRLERDEHATLALIRYTDDGTILVGGGHEDIVVCRARGACELIRTPGPWIGAFRDVGDSNVDAAYRLEPGDVMLLYTDGITEALDANGNQFGLERLCSELMQVRGETAGAIHEHILRRVLAWQISQEDDITLLVARYTGQA